MSTDGDFLNGNAKREFYEAPNTVQFKHSISAWIIFVSVTFVALWEMCVVLGFIDTFSWSYVPITLTGINLAIGLAAVIYLAFWKASEVAKIYSPEPSGNWSDINEQAYIYQSDLDYAKLALVIAGFTFVVCTVKFAAVTGLGDSAAVFKMYSVNASATVTYGNVRTLNAHLFVDMMLFTLNTIVMVLFFVPFGALAMILATRLTFPAANLSKVNGGAPLNSLAALKSQTQLAAVRH